MVSPPQHPLLRGGRSKALICSGAHLILRQILLKSLFLSPVPTLQSQPGPVLVPALAQLPQPGQGRQHKAGQTLWQLLPGNRIPRSPRFPGFSGSSFVHLISSLAPPACDRAQKKKKTSQILGWGCFYPPPCKAIIFPNPRACATPWSRQDFKVLLGVVTTKGSTRL